MSKNLLVYKDFNSFAVISFLFTGVGFILMLSIIFMIDYDNLLTILKEHHFFTKLTNLISNYLNTQTAKKGSFLATIGISSLGLILSYTLGVLMYILGIIVVSIPSTGLFILAIKSNMKSSFVDKCIEYSQYSPELKGLNINSKMIYIYLLIRNSETAIAKEMKLLFDMLMFGRAILASLIVALFIYQFLIDGKLILFLIVSGLGIILYTLVLFYIDRILYLSVLVKRDTSFENKNDEVD